MTKKSNLFLLKIILSFLSVHITFAQAPDIEWDKTIGTYTNDYFSSLLQTTDGGYILGGYTSEGISGDKTESGRGSWDYWVVKLDATGQNIEWQKAVGGSDGETLWSVQQTTDRGYILGGHTNSLSSGDKTESRRGMHDYWVVKLDEKGNILWDKTIGGSEFDFLYSVIQTSDGGYLLGGESQSGQSGDKAEPNQGYWDYWVVKLDGTGQTIEWQNAIGGNGDSKLRKIKQTTDGGYILGGHSKAGIARDKTESNFGERDYWVVKLDATGQNIEWQKTIGGNKDEMLWDIQQTMDGGYIIGGHTKSGISGNKTEAGRGNWDYWVVKLDEIGNIEWQKTIGSLGDELLHSVIQSIDGGYILGGTGGDGLGGDNTVLTNGSADYWLVKLDATGQNIQWQKSIGGENYEEFWVIAQTADGGYIVGGESISDISGDKTESYHTSGKKDFWIAKLMADTPLEVEQSEIASSFKLLSAYPNPFNPITTITYGLDKDSYISVEIFGISGKLIITLQNEYQTQGWHSVTWNGTNQRNEPVPAGLYISKIIAGNEFKTTKLMLLK